MAELERRVAEIEATWARIEMDMLITGNASMAHDALADVTWLTTRLREALALLQDTVDNPFTSAALEERIVKWLEEAGE